MRPLPENRLDPRIKNAWRFSALIVVALCAICAAIPFPIMFASDAGDIAFAYGIVFLVVLAITIVLFVFVIPQVRYVRWRYQINESFVEIARGIIWRKRFVIPFIRVQNTDTTQGPLLRAFKLASVTVSTAAENHVIPGLDIETAEALRDRAAELARLAREDV